MYWGTDPNAAIPIGVGGTLSALKAAVSEPSVKRVVVTSSVAAVDRSKPGLITADSWNTDSIKSAWSGNPAPGAVYRALKTTAEQEAWKFVKEQKVRLAFRRALSLERPLERPLTCYCRSAVLRPEHRSAWVLLRPVRRRTPGIERPLPQRRLER